ncbi:MAG: hypothetical protein NTW86_08305 [Candidatus Sumerlaeota bacterium]|nr:hypothetical protein [Candidatus Sumerlaeota bacterium]
MAAKRVGWLLFVALVGTARADVIGNPVPEPTTTTLERSVSLYLAAKDTVSAISGELNYDASLLADPVVLAGEGAAGFATESNIVEPGKLRYILYDPAGAASLDLTKPVLTLSFRLASEPRSSLLTQATFTSSTATLLAGAPPSAISIGVGGPGGNPPAEKVDFGSFTLDLAAAPGAPTLTGVEDAGAGALRLWWADRNFAPSQYLGLAYDVYAGAWVEKGWNNTLWFPFPPDAVKGDLGVVQSGAYFAWISSQHFSPQYLWLPCANPWVGILYSGTPHTPADVSAEDRGGGIARLHWRPEIYGTWHDQIIVYKVGPEWIPTNGPSGDGLLWHFIDYGGGGFQAGRANFFEGWADFILPGPGDYFFYIRGASWLPPYAPPTTGEFATAFLSIAPP